MFSDVKALVAQAEAENKKIWELMVAAEMAATGLDEEEVVAAMAERLQVMKAAAQKGLEGVRSLSALSGGDGKKLAVYLEQGSFLTDATFVKGLAYSVATNEVNAAMGVICATPTAGSSGVLPAVILAVQEKLEVSDEVVVNHLFTAGAFGGIIANNASISGAAGGCQAEVGSASAMAAAAVVEMAGGSPRQAAHAMAIAMKNMLGLTCDPVAGLVEVPCIKRNGAGAANALAAAEMALAGIESAIPWDEVIDAMYRIGQAMPISLKETALGGLATTPTGLEWKKRIRGEGGEGPREGN